MTWGSRLPRWLGTGVCCSGFGPALSSCSLFPQVNSVNCNTSWKINLFMQFRDHMEEVLKGVRGAHPFNSAGLLRQGPWESVPPISTPSINMLEE